MDKLSPDELLELGDVISITDRNDSDAGKMFVYRGRESGYHILDEVAQ